MSKQPSMVCLGPMGNLDPTDMINLETSRIPLKASNMTSDWSLAFRSWLNVTPGWRNWFRRVAGSHRATWEQYDISQCLNLSLSEMVKNEAMHISASYYWSDAINAFLFGHGPILDVMMLTGLNITTPYRSFDFLQSFFQDKDQNHRRLERICYREHENRFPIS